MTDMFTAREIQALLQVDRSTVYRMAEAGQLPALKVGKQWRFPADQVDHWLETQISAPAAAAAARPAPVASPQPTDDSLAALLPLDCVQVILDAFSSALETMLVITDMEGHPITAVSNPCALFSAILDEPEALQKCVHTWHDLASMLSLEPQFKRSQLGLLCARSLIRVGSELKGMVVTGCLAPPQWPPSAGDVQHMAAEFGIPPAVIEQHLDGVYVLDKAQQAKILQTLPQIANVVAHVIQERKQLIGRLQAIAALTTL